MRVFAGKKDCANAQDEQSSRPTHGSIFSYVRGSVCDLGMVYEAMHALGSCLYV